MNFFLQKNQEELFRPFLISAFQKIKEDLVDEFAIEIENRNSELQLLKIQNSQLVQKLKDAEKKEVTSQKTKSKDPIIKTNESALQEPFAEYSIIKKANNNQISELMERINSYETLLKLIQKQTKSKKIDELISSFHKKSHDGGLFKNQEK